MPWRSLRPPLKPVKIPLNLILFMGFNSWGLCVAESASEAWLEGAYPTGVY